jgi:hypothetical protein
MKIEKRIEALERKFPKPPSPSQRWAAFFFQLEMSSIAFYLGEPGENDSILTSYVRGIGYVGQEGYDQFQRDFRTNYPAVNRRHNAARETLFEKFKVRGASKEALIEALNKLLAGLPPFFSRPLGGPRVVLCLASEQQAEAPAE